MFQSDSQCHTDPSFLSSPSPVLSSFRALVIPILVDVVRDVCGGLQDAPTPLLPGVVEASVREVRPIRLVHWYATPYGHRGLTG